MPAKRSAAAVAGDTSEDEINVHKVVETKKGLDKIYKDREKERAQLLADLDKKLDALRARIEACVAEHVEQLGGVHQQLVACLLRAIVKRAEILQTISGKLTQIQNAGRDLAEGLNQIHERRVMKAESACMSARDQTGTQAKRVKMGAA